MNFDFIVIFKFNCNAIYCQYLIQSYYFFMNYRVSNDRYICTEAPWLLKDIFAYTL